MSDEAAMSRFLEELDKLLKAAPFGLPFLRCSARFLTTRNGRR
jgi:hypothetical protein